MIAKKLTYPASFAGYALLMLWLFLPYLRGEVIAPTRLGTQFGISDVAGQDGRFENEKFSDYANVFLPEVNAFLNGPRSGDVALWAPYNELGRPLYHVSGFSPVYPPARLLQAVTHSPSRFITAWSLSLVFLSGIFVLLFCKQIGLTPLAGMTSAISYAASPVLLYWLAFPMFIASWCWAAGCLWSLRRMADRADLLAGVCSSFCAYSLLMTSYPQLAVYQVYIVGGYAVALIIQASRSGWGATRRFILWAGGSWLLAVLLSTPMLIDLFRSALQSNRLRPDDGFFLAAMPSFSSLRGLVREVVLATMPNSFGVPTRADYPVAYNGLSVCLLTASLIVAGVFAKVRGGRAWWIAIAIVIGVATIRPIYLFGIAHLGLGLSRTNPLSMLLMPCVMLQAHAIDSLQRHQTSSWRVASLTGAAMLALLTAGIVFGVTESWPILWSQIAVDVLVAASVVVLCLGEHHVVLLTMVSACWLIFVASPGLLRQLPSQVHSESPLTKAVAARLHDNARYAVAAPGVKALPPNFNAMIGLSSIHSYDSLSPRGYREYLHRLGGEASTYGRWNDQISPDYASASFWMSDVALVLSPTKLADPSLSCATQVESVWLCDVPRHMGRVLQLVGGAPRTTVADVTVEDPRLSPALPAKVVRDEGDAIEITVSSAPSSLLIISQQYHPDWHARVFVDGRWERASSLSVNGFFQGVVIPDGAERVSLAFRPIVRLAVLANYVWVLLFALLAMEALLAWQSKPDHDHE